MANEKPLTIKQQRFVDAYLGCLNATEAARRAGYRGNDVTLGAVGFENLKKPQIQRAISQRSASVAKRAETRIVDVREEFTKNLDFVSKLRDASEKWLVDPEDPTAFTIDPRAEEIDVVYYDGIFPKRATLAELLARVEGIATAPTPFVKTVDLREYALKTVDRIDTTLDKFARMGGDYTKEKENPQSRDEQFKAMLDKFTKLKADDPMKLATEFMEMVDVESRGTIG